MLCPNRTDGFKVGCDWTRAVFNLEYDHVAVGSSDGSVFIWTISNSEKPLVVLKNEHTYVYNDYDYNKTDNIKSITLGTYCIW